MPQVRRRAERDKFRGVRWTPSPSGAPILDGSVAWIDCAVESIGEGGDHHIVLGRVRDMRVLSQEPPLLFLRGGYGRFVPLAAPASDNGAAVSGEGYSGVVA